MACYHGENDHTERECVTMVKMISQKVGVTMVKKNNTERGCVTIVKLITKKRGYVTMLEMNTRKEGVLPW